MSKLLKGLRAIRELAWPSYRPECHYMRGPGPACAKRAAPAGSE